MAIVFVHMDAKDQILRWTCPCGQENTHNGNDNKLPDEARPFIEEAMQELANDLGTDVENVHGFLLPNTVWCIKCEEQHHTRPSGPTDVIEIIGEEYD